MIIILQLFSMSFLLVWLEVDKVAYYTQYMGKHYDESIFQLSKYGGQTHIHRKLDSHKYTAH